MESPLGKDLYVRSGDIPVNPGRRDPCLGNGPTGVSLSLVVSEGEDAPSTTNRGLSRVMAKAVMESLKGLGKLGIICDQNENHYQKLLDKLKQEKI